jgi:hypothetical protein
VTDLSPRANHEMGRRSGALDRVGRHHGSSALITTALKLSGEHREVTERGGLAGSADGSGLVRT